MVFEFREPHREEIALETMGAVAVIAKASGMLVYLAARTCAPPATAAEKSVDFQSISAHDHYCARLGQDTNSGHPSAKELCK